MNWLFFAAINLWECYYHQDEKKARERRNLRHMITGAILTLFSFMLGSCALSLLLLSSFFFFLEQPKFSFAALWTALICSAITMVFWFFGNRQWCYYDKMTKDI